MEGAGLAGPFPFWAAVLPGVTVPGRDNNEMQQRSLKGLRQ
jgi:hypothetical protein